jgi:glycosyltransferase involved in cell wall biosynthesis
MISFVVPAYNEERFLGPTLEALRAAASEAGQPYELIVVDDGSTDRTAEMARAQGARVVSVRFRQISRTRNAGAAVASGDTLIFVDADTIVPASTLRAALDALRSGAVGGGATVVLDGHVPWWAEWTLAAIGGFMRVCRLAAGCYIFCSRAAFDAAGGFDETLFAAEELAFSRRLARQGRVVILRESVTSSGRKIRTHGWRELLRLGATFARRGTGALRSRDELALWYDGRRDS